MIFIYCKFRRGGYIALGALLVGCFISSFVTSIVGHFGAGMSNPNATLRGDMLYEKPWARFGPYGVGAFFGWMYFEFTQRDKPEFARSPFNLLFRAME